MEVLAGDLRRPATYRAALAACDVCLSAALDFQDPAGTDRLLLETLRGLPPAAGGTRRLLVYTSCGAAYGPVLAPLLDEATPGNPAHPLHFRLELEQEVFALDNVRTVVVRPGFLYGQDGRSCFASTWFEQGEAGRVVYGGNLARAWSWLHVSDLANAYGCLLAHPGLDREVFCLADKHAPRGLDVARAAARAAGFTGPVEVGPALMEDDSALFDHQMLLSPAKARRVLGWAPQQPGVLADMARCYQGWLAAQRLASY